MDKYERTLLKMISGYNNQGEYPRIGIPAIERRLWNCLTDNEMQTVPIGQKLTNLISLGLIERGNENGLRDGYFITEKGLGYLKEVSE